MFTNKTKFYFLYEIGTVDLNTRLSTSIAEAVYN